MPSIPSSGQFGGSQYNNPSMKNSWLGFGLNPPQQPATPSMPSGYGAPQGGGWYNPNAANTQYQLGMQPNQAAWSGDAPGHQGQSYSYNPMTGEGGWENSSGGLQIGGTNPYGHGAITWTDPTTGMKAIDPSAIKSLLGGIGFGGGNQFEPQQYTMTDYSGPQVSAPGSYGGFDYETIGSGIDPGAVIAAQEYKLQEAMEGDMAQAGGRLGKSGFAMSTPYAAELGSAARKASQDRNAITMQYQYDAAQAQAARDLQQQLQAAQIDFGGWQTQGGWDMQSQMANQNQAMQQWLMQNQMGMGNVDMQNQYGLQNQDSQQQMMMSILGGLF